MDSGKSEKKKVPEKKEAKEIQINVKKYKKRSYIKVNRKTNRKNSYKDEKVYKKEKNKEKGRRKK